MKKVISSKMFFSVAFIIIGMISFAGNPISHENWNMLLKKHVTAEGKVNYKGFLQDKTLLDKYLNELSNTNPEESWGKDNIMAFWINAYNAYTVKLILNNYPLKSILDLKFEGKAAWDYPFFIINGEKMTLNHIEHEIIRKKYEDPRIHFAVNCASYSCPRLLNGAYIGATLNDQLNKMTKEFINNSTHNKISASKVELSQLFNWYNGDFTKQGSVIDFLNKYADIKLNVDAEISYIEYNWSLNKQ